MLVRILRKRGDLLRGMEGTKNVPYGCMMGTLCNDSKKGIFWYHSLRKYSRVGKYPVGEKNSGALDQFFGCLTIPEGTYSHHKTV